MFDQQNNQQPLPCLSPKAVIKVLRSEDGRAIVHKIKQINGYRFGLSSGGRSSDHYLRRFEIDEENLLLTLIFAWRDGEPQEGEQNRCIAIPLDGVYCLEWD